MFGDGESSVQNQCIVSILRCVSWLATNTGWLEMLTELLNHHKPYTTITAIWRVIFVTATFTILTMQKLNQFIMAGKVLLIGQHWAE